MYVTVHDIYLHTHTRYIFTVVLCNTVNYVEIIRQPGGLWTDQKVAGGTGVVSHWGATRLVGRVGSQIRRARDQKGHVTRGRDYHESMKGKTRRATWRCPGEPRQEVCAYGKESLFSDTIVGSGLELKASNTIVGSDSHLRPLSGVATHRTTERLKILHNALSIISNSNILCLYEY
jgi:hypothetical protein